MGCDDCCTEETSIIYMGCMILRGTEQVFAFGIMIFSIIKSNLRRNKPRDYRILNSNEENNIVNLNPQNNEENPQNNQGNTQNYQENLQKYHKSS